MGYMKKPRRAPAAVTESELRAAYLECCTPEQFAKYALEISGWIDALKIMRDHPTPKDTPTPIGLRDASATSARSQLEDLARAAKKLAPKIHAGPDGSGRRDSAVHRLASKLDNLSSPAVLALAEAGFIRDAAALKPIPGTPEGWAVARYYVVRLANAAATARPERGLTTNRVRRPAEGFAHGVTRMVATQFATLTGRQPTTVARMWEGTDGIYRQAPGHGAFVALLAVVLSFVGSTASPPTQARRVISEKSQ